MNFNFISKKDQIRELLNFLSQLNTFENKTLSNYSFEYYWTYHQKKYPFTKKYSLSLSIINSSLLSFSFLFFPLPLQFDHFLNAANSKKYQGAIDLWKLAFRKSALSSLDLARFISDPPCKKFLYTRALARVCVYRSLPRFASMLTTHVHAPNAD